MSDPERADNQPRHEIDRVGENLIDGELRWHASRREGGVPVEEDGVGIPPEQVRRRLIQESGEWETVLTSVPERNKAAHLLREKLNLSLAQAVERTQTMPIVVFKGTRVEAQWVADWLRDIGGRCLVRPASA
jgi:hypothetical protein